MLISNSTARAVEQVELRERDTVRAAQAPTPGFVLDPLSAAPPAGTYFVTAGERGQLLFTREGAFSLRGGTLVDSSGHAMLGFREDGAALEPLQSDAIDSALGFTASARVESDGSITYERATIDPRTGARAVQRLTLGRLALARFAAGTKLTPVDAQRVAAPPAIAPHIGRAGDGNFDAVRPFARADSGADLDRELSRLQEAYLSLDALRAADTAQRGVEKTAMDLLK